MVMKRKREREGGEPGPWYGPKRCGQESEICSDGESAGRLAASNDEKYRVKKYLKDSRSNQPSKYSSSSHECGTRAVKRPL